MSYRKIEVDGDTYEYVVGKTHLKVKGLGAISKTEFAEAHPIYDVSPLGCKFFMGTEYRVTSKTVSNMIRWCKDKPWLLT